MSNAEHLIENAIFDLKQGKTTEDFAKAWPNEVMLEETGFSPEDIWRMACHVVYSLYDGKFPLF